MDFKFEVNEGPMDRGFRIVLGVIVAALAYMKYVAAPLDLVLYVVAAVLLITGIIGFCGVYKLLGINTAKK